MQDVTERLGQYVQVYTLYSSVRPFGVSTILGGVDESGANLYVVEPSGVFFVSHDTRSLLYRLLIWRRDTTELPWARADNSQRLSWKS